MKEIGAWMRAVRKQLGFTQSQVAERLGVTYVTVSRWENGLESPSRLALRSLHAFARTALGAGSPPGLEGPSDAPEVLTGAGFRDWSGGPIAGAQPNTSWREGINILRRARAFSGLERTELAEIAQTAVMRRVPACQFLYFEDEVLNFLYVAAEGKFKILRHSASGKDFVLGFYSPGEVFGNVALLSGKPHPASAEAVVDAQALVIKTDELRSFVSRHPVSGSRLLAGLLEIVGMRQLRATRRLADMAIESVERRVAYTLFTLSVEMGLVIPFSRQEVAEMSGTTAETAIRFIQRLKRRGILRTGRRKLTIIDQRKLGLLMSDGFPIT